MAASRTGRSGTSSTIFAASARGGECRERCAAALSADGRTLWVANESHGLDILDVTSGTMTRVSGVAPGAVRLALSPDGQRVYVTNPPAGTLTIVDAAARQVVSTLGSLASPRNAAFADDGAVALVTGEGGAVYVIH